MASGNKLIKGKTSILFFAPFSVQKLRALLSARVWRVDRDDKAKKLDARAGKRSNVCAIFSSIMTSALYFISFTKRRKIRC